MTPLAELLQQGSSHGWLFLPSAVLLGALHGLEPGHSKTMMAAFIVAVRGTVTQAVLLGLAAAVSHSAVVWVVALTGMYLGARWDLAAIEPILQLASGVLIIGVASWMLLRTRRENRDRQRQAHPHDHDHGHDSDGYHEHEHADHGHPADQRLQSLAAGSQDAHELAHAEEIRRRFAGREVSTSQIVVFGLTGGLVPCPASITVLVLCLQLKRFALGVGLVLGFSIGLALTLVAVGAAAALGARAASRRWAGLGALAARAPYLSSAVIFVLGGTLIYAGVSSLR